MKNNLPFKRPFKGKGGVLRLRDEAYEALLFVERDMLSLVNDFTAAFRVSRAVTLVCQYHSRGGKAVWHVAKPPRLVWRASKLATGSQRYLSLFSSDDGLTLLARLPHAHQAAIVQFEQQRLDLNLRAMLAYQHRRAALLYLKHYEAIQSSTPEFETPAVRMPS